jgi:hypothetical protein
MPLTRNMIAILLLLEILRPDDSSSYSLNPLYKLICIFFYLFALLYTEYTTPTPRTVNSRAILLKACVFAILTGSSFLCTVCSFIS